MSIATGEVRHAVRLKETLKNGVALVFGDCHYWPGPASTAHRGLLYMIEQLKPKGLICQGDVVDLAAISRHPPIGWEKHPTVKEELDCANERMNEIRAEAPDKCFCVWNMGNHDSRFESRLAQVAPEYAFVQGIHLHDHFTGWDRAWSTWINDDVVVKHRWKGGDNAAFNNTIRSGKTTVTGHLHSGQVRPYTDYNGTRFGVDTGCIADIYGPQFHYVEDNPRNWVSSFAVLTFRNGVLLWPELCTVFDKKHIQFRGELIRVR